MSVRESLRSHGWVVAVHNDYRSCGQAFTFWLFTKGDRCVKGEGVSDEVALDRAWAEAKKPPASERMAKALASLIEGLEANADGDEDDTVDTDLIVMDLQRIAALAKDPDEPPAADPSYTALTVEDHHV